MKALSVKQPWASLIAGGLKSVETRTWYTRYRGEMLICSSRRGGRDDSPLLPRGQALCIVELVDCRPMTRDDEEAACCKVYPGAYAWVLRNIRIIPRLRVKGRQGLFDVELPGKE